MENGIIMKTSAEVVLNAGGFVFIMLCITVAICASIATFFRLFVDRESVEDLELGFFLTSVILAAIAKFGVPSFISHFDLPTGIITWGITNTACLLYCGIRDLLNR